MLSIERTSNDLKTKFVNIRYLILLVPDIKCAQKLVIEK